MGDGGGPVPSVYRSSLGDLQLAQDRLASSGMVRGLHLLRWGTGVGAASDALLLIFIVMWMRGDHVPVCARRPYGRWGDRQPSGA